MTILECCEHHVGDWILMLVTSFECWWLTLTLKEVGFWWSKPSPTSYSCNQHISSPTFVTNIRMNFTLWLKATIICILEIPLKWLHKPDVKNTFLSIVFELRTLGKGTAAPSYQNSIWTFDLMRKTSTSNIEKNSPKNSPVEVLEAVKINTSLTVLQTVLLSWPPPARLLDKSWEIP